MTILGNIKQTFIRKSMPNLLNKSDILELYRRGNIFPDESNVEEVISILKIFSVLNISSDILHFDNLG